MKLVIFDLDGTLAATAAVDSECFVQAFADVFQMRDLNPDWLEYEHATDAAITLQLFHERFVREPEADEMLRIIECFLGLLRERHKSSPAQFTAVPGAAALVQDLRRRSDWAVALATGSWKRSADFKIDVAGLPVNDLPAAYAEDGPSRESIVRAAIARALAFYRQEHFERVVSVGDGVWDVRTARNLKLPFIGVGDEAKARLLCDHGATHVIEDFLDPGLCLKYFAEAAMPESI